MVDGGGGDGGGVRVGGPIGVEKSGGPCLGRGGRMTERGVGGAISLGGGGEGRQLRMPAGRRGTRVGSRGRVAGRDTARGWAGGGRG